MPDWITVDDKELIGTHIEIQRDTAQTDPQKAFQAVLNLPGGLAAETLAIDNKQSKRIRFPINGIPVEVDAEIDNFTLLPNGVSPNRATAISFLIVFKLVLIGKFTIGSVPVTAHLRHP